MKAPFGHWGTQTFIAALRHDGLTAPWVIDCPMNRQIFETWVETQLAPTLKSGDMVILDNLSSHRSEKAAAILKDLGTAGWIGAFIYCAAAGIRLARFNTNIGVVDKRYFQGLPSPSGAAVLAGLIWMLVDFGLTPDQWYIIAGVTWAMAVFAGMTMVSNVPFYSFKEVNWRQRVPLWVILALVLGLSVVASRPSLVLFSVVFCYSLSGYVAWLMGLRRVKSVLPEE